MFFVVAVVTPLPFGASEMVAVANFVTNLEPTYTAKELKYEAETIWGVVFTSDKALIRRKCNAPCWEVHMY